MVHEPGGPVVIGFAFCLVMGRIRNAVAANLEPVLGPAGPVTAVDGRIARCARSPVA